MRTLILTAVLLVTVAGSVRAHDTWVETNTNLIRTGDAVYVDLKLGNHGNDHRDFRLASKTDLDGVTLDVISPSGTAYDLRPNLIDEGYTPKEGYWSAKFIPGEAGLHMVAHSVEKVVSYAPKRSVKSAKTFFVTSDSLDRVDENNPGFDRILGHALELRPISNPVTPMGPGQSIDVELLYKGEPFAGTRVSFVPRGTTLNEGFDSQYERMTDAKGRASFEPVDGNVYLIVAHHDEPEEAGEGYTSTKYSATLSVFVPQICPCCGE
jgi:uncharacterized GH25 family protein